MEPLRLKTNYRCVPALQQFYTGGPFVVSSDSSFIACACGESIKIVDSATAAIRSTLDADSESFTALALSPDDRLLFSSGHSRQIRVWDLSTLKCVRSWKVPHRIIPLSFLSINNNVFVSANVRVWCRVTRVRLCA